MDNDLLRGGGRGDFLSGLQRGRLDDDWICTLEGFNLDRFWLRASGLSRLDDDWLRTLVGFKDDGL